MTEPDRRTRYSRLLAQINSLDQFGLAEIKQAFSDEPPAFITRLVNELAAQGWLVPGDGQEADRFRWNRSRGIFESDRWLTEKLAGSQVKASPPSDRPRERLLALGAEQLKTSELIAILIRSGRAGESAVQAGEKVARVFDQKLDRLPSARPAELKEISKVIASTAYCQIMAGIELGRRVAAQCQDSRRVVQICGSEDAIAFCERHFERLIQEATREEFHIITLDTKHQVIDTHQISIGTLDASLVHPREVFRPAIKDAASAIILVHNHPSGDPTPSPEDHQVTRRLETAGENLGIDVLDHIVLGAFRTVSIRS